MLPLPSPSNLTPPIIPQRCLSPPSHYSQLTSQEIRVTLGSPHSSLHLPSFYISPITPSSLVSIWGVTQGQFNLRSPLSHSTCRLLSMGSHCVFCTLHLPSPPSLHRTSHFLICHHCFPFCCLFILAILGHIQCLYP